jgi:two-component system chemotaxis sensor kinase CheA
LEQDPENEKIIDQLFRLAHNLKGSSKAVGFPEMGEFTHKLESLLLKIKNKELRIRGSTVSLFLRSLDALQKSIGVFKTDLNGHFDFSSLSSEVENVLANRGAGEEESAPAAASEEPESAAGQRPSSESPGFDEAPAAPAETDPFEPLTPVVEESLSTKEPDAAPAPTQEVSEHSTPPAPKQTVAASPPPPVVKTEESKQPQKAPAAAPGAGAAAASSDESIRVSLSRIEKLINYVGELVIFQTVLREQVSGTDSILLKRTTDQLGKVTKEVQDLSMSLRMVPVKPTFQKMQRIVRDTSSTLNKKINLVLTGENTELDKTVLEHLSDPLLHLIRNACDHGVELPETRVANGKSDTGTVHLRAFHEGGHIVIEIQDDGGGINTEVLKKIATAKGLIKPGTVLTEKEALHLIFLPGFSTKQEVTDISGRGVGMDVVKNNIEKIQGDVQLSTVLGKGTTFKISLPLTMAIIEAMVIRVAQDRFVIPLGHIHESLRPSQKDVQAITGVGEVFTLRGENLPLYHLSKLLGKKPIKFRSRSPF